MGVGLTGDAQGLTPDSRISSRGTQGTIWDAVNWTESAAYEANVLPSVLWFQPLASVTIRINQLCKFMVS